MTQYDDTNRGALFANDKREHDKQPTHTGSINVEGREYYLSAWVKESKAGRKFFSLSVKAKDEAKKPAMKAAGIPADDFVDSDIPFN